MGAQCIDCVQAGHQRQPPSQPAPSQAGAARVRRKPVVTPVLIALNVLVYAYTAFQTHNPVDNTDSDLLRAWELWPRAVAGGDQWWRLITAGFLHYGIIHLLVNMLSLWMLGKDMEIIVGKARFLAVYAVSLLGGSALVLLFSNDNSPTAGASGAIFGLLGGILVIVLRLRLNPASVIGTIVLNLVITVSIPNISLFGHLGGLVTGALVTAALVYAPAKNRVRWQVAATAVVVLALIGLVVYGDARLASVTCFGSGADTRCLPPH